MLTFIKELAMEAGELALRGGESLSAATIHHKESEVDMVTDVDREIERFLVDRIHQRFPDHGVYGEEFGVTQADSEYRWVIDPIDGTVSFIHDLPYYSVSIALQHHRETIAGVVYSPRLGELFAAETGKGATLNGKPIHVSGRKTLTEALVSTGFACVRARHTPDNMQYFPEILHQVRGVRRSGSAALDLCNVAAGRYDAYWELCLNLYDIAAGVLIAREAGATVTDFNNGSNFPEAGVLATNGILHPAMLKFFNA